MDEYLKMAMEIVKAQASVRPMSVEDITAMVSAIAKSLAGLSGSPDESVEAAAPSVDAKKSIREKSITCLECGKVMKLITAKHLATHELSKAEYLAKHGLKKGTSLIAKGISRARKEKMQSMELWKRRGKAAPKAAAKPAKKAAPPEKKG